MLGIQTHFPRWKELVIHESSPIRRSASERLRTEARHYIPSQFLAAAPLGGNVKGFRNENLEKLTFLGSSIDLHVTQDVFEHILDPAAAFREIA
jgi:methyltransferase family protein